MTSKYQATIPRQVRDVLHLGAGDRIEFMLERGGAVRLRKAPPLSGDLQALDAMLAAEWGSDDDDGAYADL